MDKIILDKHQIADLIFKNRYLSSANSFFSRCIDGRYENEENLPALALPGADLGELALIFATANNFGFQVDQEKVFETLTEVLGGQENFHFHTDDHTDPKIPAAGCGYWGQVQLDPLSYHLEKKDIDFIGKKLLILATIISKIRKPIVVEGEHKEGAILFIKGNFGVYPRYFLDTDEGEKLVEVFVYHQTLVDRRHKFLAKKLLEKKAVILYPGCDEEYLYQVMSDETENHLMETLKRLAKGLPIFQVKFKEDKRFEIEEWGTVGE